MVPLAKGYLVLLGCIGGALLIASSVAQMFFETRFNAIRAETDRMMETKGKPRNWISIIGSLVVGFFLLATSIVECSHPTPIRDRAVRLSKDLTALAGRWEKENITQKQADFFAENWPERIIKIDKELDGTSSKISTNFNAVVNQFERGQFGDIFRQVESPEIMILRLAVDIDTVASGEKE